jgi:hypothetical protein
MPRRTRKLISRLVTNVSGPYYGHGRAIDPENPGTGPGTVSGWDDCDPDEGQDAIVDPSDPHYYQPVPSPDGQGSSQDSDDDCHVCVYHLDEYSPGRRVARKAQGAQLLFGTYALNPGGLWNLRSTPVLNESVDRIVTATSEFPESWVIDISAKEILERSGAATVPAKQQGQVEQNGDFFSILKARIRYGAAGLHYIDVDIGNSTRVSVEGEIVQVSILTPQTNYRVTQPGSEIVVPVGETAIISNTYVTASAYITETAPENFATYTQVIAIAAGDAFLLQRIDIPPRAYSVSVYSNVALATPIGFDSAIAFGGTVGSEIVLDAATLRADDVLIPQNSRQILLPFIAAAPVDTQITIVYAIR